jgi:hypothetical protein
MYTNFVSQVPVGVALRGMFDSCFSGTIWNLPNVWDLKQHKWVAQPKTVQMKNCNIMTLSGSSENQTSASAIDLDKTNDRTDDWEGAMTYHVRQYVKKNYPTKCGELLQYLRTNLSSKGFTQLPQLYSSNVACTSDFFFEG